MAYSKKNNTFHPYPQEQTIHSFFEKMAEIIPDKIAVEFQGEHITYFDLNSAANRIATSLKKSGISVGDIVAIYINRSINMIIAILATLKAGAAYLPIETNIPKERANYYIEIADVKVVLSEQNSEVLFNRPQININKIPNNMLLSPNPVVSSENIAYILFTSGSTGEPKGVMIRHYSVVNILLWMKEWYNFDENDVFLQKQPYSFDFSVYELFLWFFCGAKLCLIKPGYEGNVEILISIINKHKVTVCSFVPSMLEAFLEFLSHRGGVGRIKSLKTVIAGGEVLKYDVVVKFNHMLTKINTTRLYNIYGPTETTINVTCFDCTNYESEDKTVPIGTPIWNTRIYVLDENGEKCLDSKKGEIYISGDGVAAGYINNIELTQTVFMSDPFRSGTIMYKSGDLGRWQNGVVEFLGRADNQVKIRGYRIELEEIELHLNQFEGIKQAVVIPSEKGETGKILEVFYTSYFNIDPKDLIKYLSEKLPSYMIPSVFKCIEKFVQTASGKIDRKRVLECADIESNKITFQMFTSDELNVVQKKVYEMIINNINNNVLNTISLDADISSIGFDSATFIKTVVALENEFDFEFDDEMLIIEKFPTVRSLLEYVTSKTATIRKND